MANQLGGQNTALIKFEPKWRAVGQLLQVRTDDDIKAEPMLFRASVDFAFDKGGPITQEFIRKMPKKFFNHPTCKIDSRVHMLMPGMWPCIPGWHLDDVDRTTRADKQPDHVNPSYRSEHCMAVVGDCSLTEFLTGPIFLGDIPDGSGKTIYKEWDRLIQLADCPREQITDRAIYRFTDRDFHRGMPATKRGFRFFIRASIGNPTPARNETRFNANVYMDDPSSGW